MESIKRYDQIIKELLGKSGGCLGKIVTRLLEMRKEKSGYYQLLYQMLSDSETPKEIREAITNKSRR